jgi:hypothetical protein
MTTFWYNMEAADGERINPHALEIEANNLGHALQKIAACMSDRCTDIHVWMGYTQEARIKAATFKVVP